MRGKYKILLEISMLIKETECHDGIRCYKYDGIRYVAEVGSLLE